MSTLKKQKFTLSFVSLTAVLLLMGSGCSSHNASTTSASNTAVAAPAPDAGTDAVPQAAVEDRSADANLPPPVLTGENGAATPPPALTGDASTPPPALSAENSVNMPPVPQLNSENSPAAPIPAELAPPPADQSAQPAQAAEAAVPAPPADNSAPQAVAEAPPVAAAPAAAPAADDSGDAYVVRPGDTLMRIAYENYGDLYKWREIYAANKSKITDPNAVPPGTQLTLDPSARKTIAHNGSQYQIKSGDTLGTISLDVYGKKEKWKRLWQNNKQMISDPNKIYAGFFLFYTLTPQEREDFKSRKGVEPEDPAVSARKISSEGN